MRQSGRHFRRDASGWTSGDEVAALPGGCYELRVRWTPTLLLIPLLSAGCLVIVVSAPGSGAPDSGIDEIPLSDGGTGYRLPDGGVTTSLVEAICQVNPTSGAPGTVITFDGNESQGSPGAEVTKWVWTFGDGTSGQGAVPQHAYADAGSYTATLTATDDSGASGTTDCPVVTIAQ